MRKDFHIGQMIREEVKKQGYKTQEFAEKINCARSNVYNIFERDNIDIALLIIISKVLHRNFVLECAQNIA